MFFSAASGSPDAAINRNSFTTTFWWVSGILALMWALMCFLPKRPSSQAG
ncbi:hypothetical protein OG592_42570 (plasmid) [Streptomyces avidinii]|nr:hypothetical protein OG592_42570 [Streptomyces avidinii]